MQIIHGPGFNDDEKAETIPQIHKNILDAMEHLVWATTQLNISLHDASLARDIAVFSEPGALNSDHSVDMEMRLKAVSRLWQDPGIQTCYSRRGEFSSTRPLNVSDKYFLDAVSDRISDPRYLPIEEDIIRVRTATVGLIQYDFVMTDIQFRIIDVGGQSEERDRWIDFLTQKITCVIFLAAVDEYCQYDGKVKEEDDMDSNRLKQSIELFRQIQTFQWLDHTTFILFLNKVDVFKDKINSENIINHFDDFQGFAGDAESGLRFLRRKFQEAQGMVGRQPRMIYIHETCATDTASMRFVFEAVRDTILQINLRQYNLV